MKTHLRSLKNTFSNFFIHPSICGRSQPRITSAKIEKIAQKFEKIDFFKNRYIVIMPQWIWLNGTLRGDPPPPKSGVFGGGVPPYAYFLNYSSNLHENFFGVTSTNF